MRQADLTTGEPQHATPNIERCSDQPTAFVGIFPPLRGNSGLGIHPAKYPVQTRVKNTMLNAETIYRKATQLDTFRLQEVSDFIDFIISKSQGTENLNQLPAGLAEKTGTFWQPQPLTYYLKNKHADITALNADFWPEDESIDDFVAFIRQQRREDAEQSA
jgi:hypothetical protein